MSYKNLANSNHPGLVIFLLDISGTMGDAMPGGSIKLDVVKSSFKSIMFEMVQRSLRAETVRPRYRIGMIAYSDDAWDVLGGIVTVDQINKNSKLDELQPLYTTDTAKGFRIVKKLIEEDIKFQSSLPNWEEYPAPLVVHLTDGKYSQNTDDPEPIAQQIKQIMTPDGHVLLENIFISDPKDFKLSQNFRQWSGFLPNSNIGSAYARKLLAMSSLIPDMYLQAMRDEGYPLQKGAAMMFPGIHEEFIRMAFVMTASSSVVFDMAPRQVQNIEEKPRKQPTRKTAKKEGKNYEKVFEEAIQANIAKDHEKAFELFKDCFDNNHKPADSAAALGLIVFQYRNNIEETFQWFTKAAELGCEETYPYKYLIAILTAKGENIPSEYKTNAQSIPETHLSDAVIKKINKLLESKIRRATKKIKTSTKGINQQQADLKSEKKPEGEKNFINYTNLRPGTEVPKSGKYKCTFCGDGGLVDFFSQMTNGSLPMAPNVKAMARHQNVRYFEAGKRFTQCPTCGPATGWILIDEEESENQAVEKSHDDVITESVVCDVCNRKVFWGNGYLLTTKQVVSTPQYWEFYVQLHKDKFSEFGVTSYEAFINNPLLRISVGKALAEQSTPWMVCNECISMFNVDLKKTMDYAKRWWDSKRNFSPPGTGPVPLSVINFGRH